MTDSDAEFGIGEVVKSPSRLNGREIFMGKAREIAEFLTGRGSVEKVGIAGSLARGKEFPSDIDLVIFVNQEAAMNDLTKRLNEVAEILKEPLEIQAETTRKDTVKEESVHSYNCLGLNRMDELNLILMFYDHGGRRMPIDLFVISSDPNKTYIDIQGWMNVDPRFLLNIEKDILIFNPNTKSFEKQGVFSDEQKGMMENASYERLKEVVEDGDNRQCDSWEEYYSQRRREKSDL